MANNNEIKSGSGSKRQREVSLNENLKEKNPQDPQKDSAKTNVVAPDSVEKTPNAVGELPSDERALTQQEAESYLDEQNTAVIPNGGFDALIEDLSSGTKSELIAYAPHYFKEMKEQDFYHEAIIYIQGVDVSPWLQGSIRFVDRLNENPSQCIFTLNNAGNRFILTPENLKGEWRTAKGEDYDESAKKELYDFKADIGNNPIDPISGGRRWPLNHYGTVFHKYDDIRVWVRNPASTSDISDPSSHEWMPRFAGYIISKTLSDDNINNSSEITIICEDIRCRMREMRINTNTVFYVYPGEVVNNAGSDYLAKQYPGPANEFLNKSFFQDLTVRGIYDNPWSDLTLRELVKALTFAKSAQNIINASVEKKKSKLKIKTNKLKTELDNLRQTGADKEQIAEVQRDYIAAKRELVYLDQVSGKLYSTPKNKTGTDIKSIPGTERINKTTTIKENNADSLGQKSRMGSFQQGLFPIHTGQEITTIPSGNTKSEIDDRKTFLQDWHSMITFGQPTRNYTDESFSASVGVSGSAKNYGARNGTLNYPGPKRYWSELEVRAAGRLTKSDHAWRVDAQAVHMMEPSAGTTGESMWKELKIIDGSNVAGNRQWLNRLNLIADACNVLDYRFYVSGCGDLVFEPPMYDFSPSDFGTWKNVFEYNHHTLGETLDEERNQIKTVVVATGSYTGLKNVVESEGITNYIPKYVVVWSPMLVARFGMQVEVLNYPCIRSLKRLKQLAYLYFQKMIGLADVYDIQTVYRPWPALNRPIYNKYKARFALVSEFSHTLPVTQTAGDPQSQLALSYTRPLDEAGIPRYLTGGAAQAVFFGEVSGNASIAETIAKRAQSLRDAISKIQRNKESLTSFELAKIREVFGGFLPLGQDVYNVIKLLEAESSAKNVDGSTEEENLKKLDENRKNLEAWKLQNEIIDSATPKEIDPLLEIIDTNIQTLKDYGVKVKKSNGDVNAGQSGVYDIYMDNDTDEDENAPEPAAQPSPPERGAQGFVLKWDNINQGSITYTITREDRATLISYLTWQGQPIDFVLWTWLQGFAYQYPTISSLSSYITTEAAKTANPVPSAPTVPQGNCIGCFGYVRKRNNNGTPKHTHQGVDIGNTTGQPIVAALSGDVTHASEAWEAGFSGYGKHVVVKSDKYDNKWTLYAHMDTVSVKVGDRVYKGQQLGTVGATGFYRTRTINGKSQTIPVDERTSNTKNGIPHLHWEVATHQYPQSSSETNRINPVPFLEAYIDEEEAPDYIINTINDVLSGVTTSRNTKATIYLSGTYVEIKAKRITKQSLKGLAAAEKITQRYKKLGTPISIDEGFDKKLNYFFENPDGISIPIEAYREETT